MNKNHVIIPVFIPHKGCPFDCIYCNQKSISGQMEEMTESKMVSIIEEHLSSIDTENTFTEIAFYGGSFTGIEQEQQIRFLEVASRYVKERNIKGLRLSTRPDYISEQILEYLKSYNVHTIELGVQSLDEEVLKKSCRGHGIEDVIYSSKLIKSYDINLGIQTMIGLPGDTAEKSIDTAKKVVELEPKIVRIYPTLVVKNTYLEEMYKNKAYAPLSLEEAVDISSKLLDIYRKNNINVIRIGLQPSENINSDMDVVAGPFHPAFRQLVESRLILKRIENIIDENGLQNEEKIIIYTSPKNLSDTIGQKRENIRRLKEKFNFRGIDVIQDNDLKDEIRIITKF